MRWAALFEDLESQLEAAVVADRAAAADELARAETAAVTLAGRLRGEVGPVRARLADGSELSGRVAQVAEQWVLLETERGQAIVPLAGVDVVHGLGRRVSAAHTGVAARLSLGHALRALARDRVTVRVHLRSADLTGRIDRVARDHVEITSLDPAARGGASGPQTASQTVPFTAILSVCETV